MTGIIKKNPWLAISADKLEIWIKDLMLDTGYWILDKDNFELCVCQSSAVAYADNRKQFLMRTILN